MSPFVALSYYNEIDPFAAAWLRELINQGHIAPGVVDERDIRDVLPRDLKPYTQCHFFAGVGVWSYALRKAGWGDHRPIWTGSCPCQPFSSAGKGGGFADERHLWPSFHYLIEQCRPSVVLGEQVASKAADSWIDLVQTDMETLGYAFGAVPFPSAGIGAPHIRDRTYWMADANGWQRHGQSVVRGIECDGADAGRTESGGGITACREPSRLAHSMRDGAGYRSGEGLGAQAAVDGSDRHLSGKRLRLGFEGESGWVDNTTGARHSGSIRDAEGNPRHEARLCLSDARREISGLADSNDERQRSGAVRSIRDDEYHPQPRGGVGQGQPGPTNGLWRDADWLFCRDGKWRPVEPGTFPLAYGATARVGRLRGYGNAINAEAAIAFIQAALIENSIDCGIA